MDQPAEESRLERFIAAMDKPLLALAVVAVATYLLFLRGAFDEAPRLYFGLALAVDLIFVIDLSLKLFVLRRSYWTTPWFLIDLLSCVPILETIGGGMTGVEAVPMVRVLRMFRVLRAMRVLRVLRSLPVFERFIKDAQLGADAPRFNRALTVGVLAFTLAFLLLVGRARRHAEEVFVDDMTRALQAGADLRLLDGSLEPAPGTLKVRVDGVDYFFSDKQAEREAQTVEFYLLSGTVITMTLFMFLMRFQLRDVSYNQLHTLLNVALPRQVVDEFMKRPHAYAEKSRDCATVLFMDFVGFTQTCENFNANVDTLAHNLETAMDRVVQELNKYDLIIDKFIGDAVMCFRGGPLVAGTPEDHACRSVRAALAASKALAELNNPYFSRLKIGGASATHCLIGAFGTSTRLSYTTLGDGVNLAARLEPASAQCQTDNLFCSTTYELCAGADDIAWRRWGRIYVAGKALPEHVYEAFDAATLDDDRFLKEFSKGLQSFEGRDFQTALVHFKKADALRPGGDGPSRHYIQWCEDVCTSDVDSDWQPVLRTKK